MGRFDDLSLRDRASSVKTPCVYFTIALFYLHLLTHFCSNILKIYLFSEKVHYKRYFKVMFTGFCGLVFSFWWNRKVEVLAFIFHSYFTTSGFILDQNWNHYIIYVLTDIIFKKDDISFVGEGDTDIDVLDLWLIFAPGLQNQSRSPHLCALLPKRAVFFLKRKSFV